MVRSCFPVTCVRGAAIAAMMLAVAPSDAQAERWMGTVAFAFPLNVEVGGVHHSERRFVDLGARARYGSDGAAFEAIARTWRGPVGLVLAAGVGSHGNSGKTSAQGITGAIGLEIGGVMSYRLVNLYAEARSIVEWANEPADRVTFAIGLRAYL